MSRERKRVLAPRPKGVRCVSDPFRAAMAAFVADARTLYVPGEMCDADLCTEEPR